MIAQIRDFKDPMDPEGRTYREINAARQHKIPVGALVEIQGTGCRLFVVQHTRDCDQTPLYYLSVNKDDTVQKREGFRNHSWVGGYAETSLQLVR